MATQSCVFAAVIDAAHLHRRARGDDQTSIEITFSSTDGAIGKSFLVRIESSTCVPRLSGDSRVFDKPIAGSLV